MQRGDRGQRAPGRGALRSVLPVLGAVAFGVVLVLSTESGPLRTRLAGRVLGTVVLLVGMGAYLGAERRRRRTEKDFADRPWLRRPAAEGSPADDGPHASSSDAPGAAAGGPQGAPRANLEGMLVNADDALLALRDLASHGDPADYGVLPTLLRRIGFASWEEMGPVRAIRLRRNGRWWLAPRSGGELSERDYDRLTSLEAALNINDDVMGRSWPERMSPTWRLTQVLSEIAELRPVESAPGSVPSLIGGVEGDGEWACRLRFANTVENLPAPFRIEMAFQANLERGLFGIGVVTPRPGCLALMGARSEAAWARAYALRLALLLARRAFAASRRVERVVVNCHEHGSRETLLSLDLSHETLKRLAATSGKASVVDRGLPSDPALRFSLDAAGWFRTVEPFLELEGEQLSPAARYREPELDGAPCTDALASSCGARTVSDLGIMEKAPRAAAWNAIVGELGTTTQGAVSRLMALRDETVDLTVAQACERACAALVEGTADVSDLGGLARLFVDGGTLGSAVAQARRALGEGQVTPDQLETALGALQQAISPIEQTGIYLDDANCVYRYFNSVPERVSYNLAHRDDDRRVRLVPDEYYIAHSCAARILGMLGRHDEALAHAEALVRMAPATPDAALSKVRCLEEQSRIFESAELLMRAIEFSSTARDMSICFYRLAFMEWKLGRSDLAVACYQRAISLHEEVAAQARDELADLLEAGGPGLAPLDEKDVVPALEAGGIPAGPVDLLRERLGAAAGACVDAGVLSAARPLMGAFVELTRDDALTDVYRSLMRP